MYIIDLTKRILHASNITIFIYLLLNIATISAIVFYLFYVPLWEAVILGFSVYVISLVLAVSPFGEWLLRITNECKKIKDIEILNHIEPLFIDVKREAIAMNSSISNDVTLFIKESEEAFAFATGRKTICISKGLLKRPSQEISAALAHEFGHLAHKDTDLLLMVSVGNMIVQAILIIIKLVLIFIELIMGLTSLFLGGKDMFIGLLMTFLYQILWTISIGVISWIWNMLGTVLVMRACRQNEYAADEFAYNLGYGEPLCSLLQVIDMNGYKGLFSSLASSHPPKEKRIERIKMLLGTL